MTSPTTADRRITHESLFNLRDLGGYTATNGRRVRWRTMYRADGLHRVADPEGLQHLGWRTVIDLRTPQEVERGRFVTAHASSIHLPVLAEPWDTATLARNDGTAAEFLSALYLDMLNEGATSIAAVFQLLGSSFRLPLVFHCSAGKDRTGIVAALVLAALGVDDDQIALDYHLTSHAMDGLKAYIRLTEPQIADAMVLQPAALAECPPEAMHLFLAGIRARYGSVGEYLAAIGVRARTLDALRDNALEDGSESDPARAA